MRFSGTPILLSTPATASPPEAACWIIAIALLCGGGTESGRVKPEHAGKLNFYLSAVDTQVKSENDSPTIGLLLYKTHNRVVAEYALRDSSKPIGVTEYQLVESLPKELQISLPSIEQIERELGNEDVPVTKS